MALKDGVVGHTVEVLDPETVALPDIAGSPEEPAITTTSRLGQVGRGVLRRWQALLAVPHLGTYAGVALCGIGAVLLTVAWGETAGLTVVSLQIPYLISAGFTGLGLVVVGLTIVNVFAKAADSRDRARQTAELRDLLSEVRKALAETVEERR